MSIQLGQICTAAGDSNTSRTPRAASTSLTYTCASFLSSSCTISSICFSDPWDRKPRPLMLHGTAPTTSSNHYTPGTSQFRSATFQVLNSHTWLMATKVDTQVQISWLRSGGCCYFCPSQQAQGCSDQAQPTLAFCGCHDCVSALGLR